MSMNDNDFDDEYIDALIEDLMADILPRRIAFKAIPFGEWAAKVGFKPPNPVVPDSFTDSDIELLHSMGITDVEG